MDPFDMLRDYILPAIIDESTTTPSTTEPTTSPTTTDDEPPDYGPLFIGLSVGGVAVVAVLIVYFVKKR